MNENQVIIGLFICIQHEICSNECIVYDPIIVQLVLEI
jgi:hypothetical protein